MDEIGPNIKLRTNPINPLHRDSYLPPPSHAGPRSRAASSGGASAYPFHFWRKAEIQTETRSIQAPSEEELLVEGYGARETIFVRKRPVGLGAGRSSPSLGLICLDK